MISCFASRSIALGACALVAACSELRETPIEITVDSCEMASPDVTMNTYIVQLFEAVGNEAGARCSECSQEICAKVDEQCACGNDVPATAAELSANLRGLRFADVDAGQGYCIHVIALDLAASATSERCECPVDWQAMQKATARLCGLTEIEFANDRTSIAIDHLTCAFEDPTMLAVCLDRFTPMAAVR